MKRKLSVILAVSILLPMLFSCEKNDSTPASSSIYRTFFEETVPDSERNDQYNIAAFTSDGTYTSVTVTRESGNSITFTKFSADGDVLEKRSFPLPDEILNVCGGFCGERGLYLIWNESRNDDRYNLSLYSYDGTSLAAVNLNSLKPDGVTKPYPGEGGTLESPIAQQHIPMAETDEHAVILWQNTLLFFDDALTLANTVKLPGGCASVWNDNGLRVTYIKDSKPMTASIEDFTVTGVREMPGRFSGDMMRIFACENDVFYAYDTSGAFRWSISDGAKVEPVEILSFTMSGINARGVRCINPIRTAENALTAPDSPALMVFYSVSNYDYRRAWMSQDTTAAQQNPEDITTIVIATPGMSRKAPQAVVEFNQSHSDIQIVIEDYSKYSTAENPEAKYTRLRMDLETGVLKPDLVVAMQPYYAKFLRGMGTYFADLDTLMTANPDAGIAPDNIWQSVRSAFTYEGGMRGITPGFFLKGPVGLKENLGAMTSWTLDEFLDFAETVPEGVYFTESLRRKDTVSLFGSLQWDTFTAQANFDDPLYVRYLEFLKSLPSDAPELITRETAYDPEFDMTVDVTEDPDRIYRDGDVLLYHTSTASPMGYLELMQKFGAETADELTFIGYPTNDAGGMKLANTGECVYMIPSKSEHTAEAWEFVAYVLKDYAASLTELEEREIHKYGSKSPAALKAETLAYFESLIGYQTWETVRGSWSGWNLETEGEGTLLTITEDVIAGCTALLDQATSSYLFTETPDALAAIISEEESAYLAGNGDAASAAKTTQSRAAIYLAEQN